VDDFLDNPSHALEIVPKYSKTKKSKIEKAGEDVMIHLIKLATDEDLSYQQMAKKINAQYDLTLTKGNVVTFFQTNKEAVLALAAEQKSLAEIRAELYLEPNNQLVKDIKMLDDELDHVLADEFIESDKRAKCVGDLIDKKGRLLLRHARLSGKLTEKSSIDKMQINIFEQVNETKSEIIHKLKKAEFNKENTIDITPKED